MNKVLLTTFLSTSIFFNSYSNFITIFINNIKNPLRHYVLKRAKPTKIIEDIKRSSLNEKIALASGSGITALGIGHIIIGDFISGSLYTGAGLSITKLALRSIRLKPATADQVEEITHQVGVIKDQVKVLAQAEYSNLKVNVENSENLKNLNQLLSNTLSRRDNALNSFNDLNQNIVDGNDLKKILALLKNQDQKLDAIKEMVSKTYKI